jgi:DNA-binding transcriptional LysR family regulator
LIQMTEPVETAELAAFAKVIETRSLSRAAAELGVPRATLSRRLGRLEERLGARLLRRSTRSLTPTDAGESLYRHARIVLDAVRNAEDSVRRVDDAVRGDLRVSVPPIVTPSFRTLLCGFAERYPEVRLQVHFSTRHVDLRRDGYDVAMRATTELEPGLIARPLSREPMLCVAAPSYLAQHAPLRRRQDLTRHRCLMGFTKGELPQAYWVFRGGSRLHLEGALFSNDLELLRDAAVRGLGIAYLPLMVLYPALENGSLVPILPDTLRGEALIAVVYAEREFVPPAVRAFVDAVVEWAPAELGRQVPLGCREAMADTKPQAPAARVPARAKKRRLKRAAVAS